MPACGRTTRASFLDLLLAVRPWRHLSQAAIVPIRKQSPQMLWTLSDDVRAQPHCGCRGLG